MKRKLLVNLLVLLLGTAAVTGCKGRVKYEASTVSDVVNSGVVDTYYNVTGKVLAKAGTTSFVTDGSKIIQVETSSELEVGSIAAFKGKYTLDDYRPVLQVGDNVVSVKEKKAAKLEIGEISPSEYQAYEVYSFENEDSSNYSKYITITGWMVKGETYCTIYSETSDSEYTGVRFTTDQDVSQLEAVDGKYVTVGAYTLKNASNKWYLVYDGNGVTDKTPSEISATEVANVEKQLKAEMGYKKYGTETTERYADVCGSIELPWKHYNSYVNGLTYTWEAKEYTLDSNNQKVYVYEYKEVEDVTATNFATLGTLYKAGTEEGTYVEVTAFDSTVSKYYAKQLSNGGIVIDNETKTVKAEIPSADKKVELTCTITRNGVEGSKTVVVEIVNKALVETTITDILDNGRFYNMSAVKFSGVVIAKAQNQSGNSNGLIIADNINREDSIQVEVNFDAYVSYNINSLVTVTGYYRNSDADRFTVTSEKDEYLTTDEVVSAGEDLTGDSVVKYTDAQCALIIDSKEDLEELFKNYNSKYVGRLVKFVNPSLKLTKRTGGNTVDISYEDCGEYAINGTTTEVTPCFVTSRIDASFGSTAWRSSVTEEAKTTSMTIYAIPSYYSGLAIFTIPTADQIEFTQPRDQITYKIASEIKSLARLEGDISLPASVTANDETIALTWSAEEGQTAITINGTTAECTYGSTDKVVKLTATYNSNSQDYTSEIEITLIGNEASSYAALGSANEGQYVYLEGVVVAYATSGSFTTAGKARTGWVLMEKSTGRVIYSYKANQLGGSILEGFTVNNTAVSIGDTIKVYGIYHVDSENPGSGVDGVNKGRAIIDCSEYTVVAKSSADKITDLTSTLEAATDVITVSSDDELKALVANGVPFGKVIKFVATKDNPIYFQNGSSKDMTSSSNTVVLRFGYSNNGDSGKTSSYDCQYDSESSVSLQFGLSAYANELTYKNFTTGLDSTTDGVAHFWTQLGFKNQVNSKKYNGISGTGAANTKTVYGSFYAVVGYVNSTYYHMALVDPVNTWNVYNYEALTVGSLDSSFMDGDELTLPTTVGGKTITWSTTSEEYEVTTEGKLAKISGKADLTANTIVTVKATVADVGVEYTKEITVEKKAVKTYQLVTGSVNTTDTYILVGVKNSTYNTIKIGTNPSSADNVISLTSKSTGVLEFSDEAEYYTLKEISTGKYFFYGTEYTINGGVTKTNKGFGTASNDKDITTNGYGWTISISSSGEATITGSNTSNSKTYNPVITFNQTSGIFERTISSPAPTTTNVYLYKLVTE